MFSASRGYEEDLEDTLDLPFGSMADVMRLPEADPRNAPRLKEATPAKIRRLRSVREPRTQDSAVAPAGKTVTPQREAKRPAAPAAAVAGPSRVEELLAMALRAKMPSAWEQGALPRNKDSYVDYNLGCSYLHFF